MAAFLESVRAIAEVHSGLEDISSIDPFVVFDVPAETTQAPEVISLLRKPVQVGGWRTK